MGGPYHGKNGRFYRDGYDLTGHSSNVSFGQTTTTAEVTCFGNEDAQHVGGAPKSWTATISSFWDDTTTTGTEDIYRTALGASGICTFWPAGTTIGYRGRGTEGDYETQYTVTSPVAGAVTAEVQLTGNGAMDPVRCLGASTSTSTGASAAFTAYNYAASSVSQGLVHYAHVTAIAGTDPSLALVVQESADNETFTDLITCAAITAVGAQRTTLTGSVAQYVRTKYTPNASTTSVTFVSGFHRDEPV